MRVRNVPIGQRHSIYPGALSAVPVLAEILDIEAQGAKDVLVKLVKAGFVIAPLEPTNPMLCAYMTALGSGTSAKARHTIMTNIGKARKRWRAMAKAGTLIALSLRVLPDQSEIGLLPALELEELDGL